MAFFTTKETLALALALLLLLLALKLSFLFGGLYSVILLVVRRT